MFLLRKPAKVKESMGSEFTFVEHAKAIEELWRNLSAEEH